MIHYVRRNYVKAEQDLLSALTLNPGDKDLHFKLGESYFYSGKYSKAIQQFDRVIKIDNRDLWAYYRKGFSHKSLRQSKQAIRAFEVFLDLAPKKHRRQILSVKTEIKKLKKQI